MKTYYKVSFEYSEGIYCTNMAHAESAADVEKHYKKYTWCSVREAAPYELDEAKAKGMPIIEIEHEEPATDEPAQTESKEEEKKMENYTINKNADFNSLEITFAGKPSEAIRDALKALKFRWHSIKHVWYGYTTEEAARAAIDGAEGKKSTQDAQTVKASSSAAAKPDQGHIRIYYNGIKIDGGKLIKCYYSIDNNADNAESVSIIAANYDDLPRDLLPVRNDTDIYTDYFDKDSAYITPEHPLYKYFRYAGLKDRAKSAEKRMETVKAELNSGRERWAGHFDAYRRELVQLQAQIDEYKAAADPGQPTAADLDAINRQRQEQENAEREARHAEELAERERVLNARNDGRRFIEATAKAYPVEEGAPVVTIEWSEHPAFYDWNDKDTLKLSVAAAEIILKTLDAERHKQPRGGYDKTSFRINWKDENGEEMQYNGRYNLGDNDGGLIAHIRSIGEWERTHKEHGQPKEQPDETNDRLQSAEYLQQFTA